MDEHRTGDGSVDDVEERDSVLGELTRLEKAVEVLRKKLTPVSQGLASDETNSSGSGSVVRIRLAKVRLDIEHMRKDLDL